MKFATNIKKAARLSPKVLARKLLRKIRGAKARAAARKRADESTTFPQIPPDLKGDINRFIRSIDFFALKECKNEIFEKAEKILKREFDLLGSRPVILRYGMEARGLLGQKFPPRNIKYNPDAKAAFIREIVNRSNFDKSLKIFNMIDGDYSPIDWNIDFKSGYCWSAKTWSKDVEYGFGDGDDIKIPWELGRLRHLTVLAYAYALSAAGEKKFRKKAVYLREFRNQILDFIATNPPEYGVQWASSMELAIGAANLLVALDIFAASGAKFDPEFKRLFSSHIYVRAKHIRENLEYSDGMRGNHYLANIAGLAFAGAYLPDCVFSREILDFAARELAAEIIYQFLPDGGNFEASTAYHALSTEIVIYSIAALNSLPENRLRRIEKYLKNYNIRERISKILQFTDFILIENVEIARFGDDDSGRFLSLGIIDNRAKYYELQSIVEIFRRNENMNIQNAFDAVLNETNIELPSLGTRLFQNFGLFATSKGDYRIWIRCGGVGQKGKGGHSHNDALSFEMRILGEPLFVESGTYHYTANRRIRNQYRSTAAANTLQLGEEEQNDFDDATKDDLFWTARAKAQPKIIRAGENLFEGEHKGFSAKCARRFEFRADGVDIIDYCDSSKSKTLRFHMPPGCDAKKISGESAFIIKNANYAATISFNIKSVKIEDYDFSPEYGRVEPAKLIAARTQNREILTQIRIK